MTEMPDGEDIECHGEISTLALRRCADGRVVFAMKPHDDRQGYAMVVTAANVMALIAFMLNQPEGAPS